MGSHGHPSDVPWEASPGNSRWTPWELPREVSRGQGVRVGVGVRVRAFPTGSPGYPHECPRVLTGTRVKPRDVPGNVPREVTGTRGYPWFYPWEICKIVCT